MLCTQITGHLIYMYLCDLKNKVYNNSCYSYSMTCSVHVFWNAAKISLPQCFINYNTDNFLLCRIETIESFHKRNNFRQDFRITPYINYAYSFLFNKTIAETMELLWDLSALNNYEFSHFFSKCRIPLDL